MSLQLKGRELYITTTLCEGGSKSKELSYMSPQLSVKVVKSKKVSYMSPKTLCECSLN